MPDTPPSEDVAAAVGARLRALRQERGLSLSELARRAGVGKATLSRLETGGQNPTMETLYALTTALRAPLSAVLPQPSGGSPERAPTVSGTGVSASLLDVVTGPTGTAETYRLTFAPGQVRRSAPHAAGVTEHVVVLEGTVRVGTGGDQRVLGPGEHHGWGADTEHVYAAEGAAAAVAVLVVRHPPSGAAGA